jgi:hypothetical protein
MLQPVQTFWIEDQQRWLSDKFSFISNALSAHMLKSKFGKATLYTDTQGADLLIGKLDLPYTDVVLSLNNWKDEFGDVWVLKKMMTYSQQSTPFIHVDSDAYLFAELSEVEHNAEILAQNMEFDHPYYLEAVNGIKTNFLYIPKFAGNRPGEKIWAVNAGLVGGNNVNFFKLLFEEAIIFLRRNRRKLGKISGLALNTYIEQYMLKQLADSLNLKIKTIVDRDIGPSFDYHLHNFAGLPCGERFLHVLSYKRNPTICEFISQRLFLEAPQLYEKCLKISKTTTVVFSKPRNKDKFHRTIELLGRFGRGPETEDTNDITERKISESVQQTTLKKQKELLRDLFGFEKAKWKFFQSIDGVFNFNMDWRAWSRKCNLLLAQHQSVYDEALICLSRLCIRLPCKWNWAETNEFSSQTAREAFDTNIDEAPGYFEVLVYYSHNLGHLREQVLDYVNILIFDELVSPVRIRDIKDHVVNFLREMGICENQQDVHTLVDQRIRHFLYIGVIQFAVD